MTISEKLTTSKNALDGALRLANATTEAEDSNICDAINTLIDGYGQGGGDGFNYLEHLTNDGFFLYRYANIDASGQELDFDFKNAKTLQNAFYGATIKADKIRVNTESCTSIQNMFYNAQVEAREFELNLPNNSCVANNWFFGKVGTNVETLTINGNPNLLTGGADNGYFKPKYVYSSPIPINLTWINLFSVNLLYIRVVENSYSPDISASMQLAIYNADAMDNDTLVNIVNGLNESISRRISFSLSTKWDDIRGNSVLSADGTYHNFVEDANGEMTMAEFITNVKGWTTVR